MIKDLLFPDWELGALLNQFDPTKEDEFSLLISSIQGGEWSEAEDWLEAEMRGYPWVLLAAAHVKLQMNEPAEAGRLLRAVTLIAPEARPRLWAWHNLRRLGKFPAPDLATQTLGVVVEVPIEEGLVDTIAAYADGSARYLHHTGGSIVWDTLDEEITPKVLAIVRDARLDILPPMGEPRDDREDGPLPAETVRLSIFTPGGIYVWEGTTNDHPAFTRLFAQLADLLRALIHSAIVQKQELDEEGDGDEEGDA